MWEWFIINGVWIIPALVVGLVLFFLLQRWAKQSIQKLVPEPWHEQLKGTQKVVTRVIISIGGIILALAVAAVIVPRYGINITPALEAVGAWLLGHGILILIIILLSYLTYKVVKVVVPRVIGRLVTVRGKGRSARHEMVKRTNVLSKSLSTAIGAAIIIAAIFMIFSEIGLDITPLLAGAGVVGIAIGFGAQSLIRDFINGLFIIL